METQTINEQIEQFKKLAEQIKSCALQEERKDIDIQDISNLEDEVVVMKEKFSNVYEDISKLFFKILGQMYNGVLIDEEITIRKGNIFKYKCQSSPNAFTLKQELTANLPQVERKLGREKFALFSLLLNRLKVDNNGYGYRNGVSCPNKEIIIKFSEPIISIEKNSYNTEFDMKEMVGIRINQEGITLLKQERKDYERYDDIETDFKPQIYSVYRNQIVSALKEVQAFLTEEYDKLEVGKAINEMKTLGGDYLIVANLKQEKENENEN